MLRNLWKMRSTVKELVSFLFPHNLEETGDKKREKMRTKSDILHVAIFFQGQKVRGTTAQALCHLVASRFEMLITLWSETCFKVYVCETLEVSDNLDCFGHALNVCLYKNNSGLLIK